MPPFKDMLVNGQRSFIALLGHVVLQSVQVDVSDVVFGVRNYDVVESVALDLDLERMLV